MILKDAKQYIESCVRVTDGERERLVLCTAERAYRLSLCDGDGRAWQETTNDKEPIDCTVHVLYLPPEAFESTLEVRCTDKDGECIRCRVTPDMISRTTREEFITFSDHKITPVSVVGHTLCERVWYKTLECKNADGAPVRAYALIYDPAVAELYVGTANDGYAPHTDTQTAMGQVEASIRNGRQVLAATNADFFDMFGGNNAPSGLCVKNGRVVANADSARNFFGTDDRGRPVITSLAESPELSGRLRAAVSGREIYLRDGKLAELSLCEPFSYVTHPRTTVGIREDGMVIVMVVDGRLPEISNGASLVDLASLMTQLGATRAINMDGGGSCTFIVNQDGKLTMLNRPADLADPTAPLIRPLFNTIQIIKK